MERLSITHVRGQWTCTDIANLIDLYGRNGGNIWEIEPRMFRLWINNINGR